MSKSQKCMIRAMARAVWVRRLAAALGAPARWRAMAGSELPAGKREQAPALHMPDFDVTLRIGPAHWRPKTASRIIKSSKTLKPASGFTNRMGRGLGQHGYCGTSRRSRGGSFSI